MSKIGRPKEVYPTKHICKNCHKEFEVQYADRRGIFCSKDCHTQFSRENASNYRIKAFALLPNECFYCGEKNKKLVVHHLDNDYLNNNIKNLRITCNKCHRKEHHGDNSRFYEFKDNQIIRAWRQILDGLRLDVHDANFKDTPARILRSYYEMFSGLNFKQELHDILGVTFPTEYDGMIIEGPIRCYSMCPHHFLPVIYDVWTGYIPTNGGLGLSKIPRLIELLAKAPKLQEDFTKDIVKTIDKTLSPQGVICVVKGDHLCMQMRGIKKPNCTTTTSSITGVFKEKLEAREEFLKLANIK